MSKLIKEVFVMKLFTVIGVVLAVVLLSSCEEKTKIRTGLQWRRY